MFFKSIWIYTWEVKGIYLDNWWRYWEKKESYIWFSL